MAFAVMEPADLESLMRPAAEVGVFISMSTFLGLCIDEPALFRMLGLPWGNAGEGKRPRTATVVLMWLASFSSLVSGLLCASATRPSSALIFVPFASITVATTLFALHCAKLSLTLVIYLVAISAATARLDRSLMPLVAATDTAVAPLLGSVLVTLAPSTPPPTRDDVARTRADAITEGRRRAIAGACGYSRAKGAALLSALLFACALESTVDAHQRLLAPVWASAVRLGHPYATDPPQRTPRSHIPSRTSPPPPVAHARHGPMA
jgi:hypothetical protein